jgi:APA family basic amino acid/polyamine antiporter
MQEDNKEEFKRELGLMDGTMLVVGSMIGSGIFIVSSDMVRQVQPDGSSPCGFLPTITVIAAVSYGELSAMFPKAGGHIYIKEAYGKLVGFLYGWSFAVIQTGTIAAVGVACCLLRTYFQLLVIKISCMK